MLIRVPHFSDMLSVAMLSVIILNATTLSVVAPGDQVPILKTFFFPTDVLLKIS